MHAHVHTHTHTHTHTIELCIYMWCALSRRSTKITMKQSSDTNSYVNRVSKAMEELTRK